jgi:hypothetical protein
MWGGDGTSGGGGGGVSSSQLAGMLIGYATETWVDEHYISIDFFSRLFQAHGTENGSEIDVMPNDLETTITSVESMFGFWTNLYISALGSNGAAPAGISLGMLTDVTISGTPSAGQVLTFDAVSGMWVNGNGGASSLTTLTDVTLTSLASGQTLLYDSTTSKWYNSALKTINGQSLLGSGDISVGGGASGNYLPLSGGTLTNANWRSQLGINRDNAWKDSVIAFYVSNTLQGCLGFRGSDSKPCVWYGDADTGIEIATVDTLNQYLPLTGGTLTGNLTISNSWLKVGEYAILEVKSISADVDYLNLCVLSGSDSHTYDRPLVIQNGYGNVGIGKTAPSYKLEVNGTGYFSDKFRVQYLEIGYSNEINSLGGQYEIHLNYRATGVVSICNGGGNVGIGTGLPSYKLHVAGTIYATGAITALSDARKKDITGEAELNVEQIARAPAVQFLWKDKERRKDGQQVGTLAQYWRTVLPEVVSDKGGELSMQYGVAALVSSIIIARKVANHEVRIDKMEKWMKKWAEENDE